MILIFWFLAHARFESHLASSEPSYVFKLVLSFSDSVSVSIPLYDPLRLSSIFAMNEHLCSSLASVNYYL